MRTVVVYGNSLLVASLEATLARHDDLRLVHMADCTPEAASRLAEQHPDVLLIDLAEARPKVLLALFQAQPGMLILGIDLEDGRLLALSGQQSLMITEDDLMRAIRGAAGQAGWPA